MYYRILCLLFFVMPAYAAEEPLTVVELFTSQGCYSCPPADEYLGALAQRDNVITLSCHVTYWNYIGWKDTFSRKFCDNRQRQYQGALLDGRRGVYTPQMIINGRYAGVGSRRGVIDRIIDYDRRQQSPLAMITLSRQGDELLITLPKLSTDLAPKQRQIFLLGTIGEHLLPISSGENSGKELPYFNPVEYVENLGNWGGEQVQKQVAVANNPHIKDWLVVAQTWPVGEMVAAGRLAVKP